MKRKLTQAQLRRLIKEEYENLQYEGTFSSALKTLATNTLPGGRYVSDFARSQAFDKIEERLDEIEHRLRALEQRP